MTCNNDSLITIAIERIAGIKNTITTMCLIAIKMLQCQKNLSSPKSMLHFHTCLLQHVISFLRFWSELIWSNCVFLSLPSVFSLTPLLDAESPTSPAAPPTTSYKPWRNTEHQDNSRHAYIYSYNVYIKGEMFWHNTNTDQNVPYKHSMPKSDRSVSVLLQSVSF